MRLVVIGLAALAFAAGMVLNWPGVAQLVLFCAGGGCGVPQRGVLLGLAGTTVAVVALVAWRRRRTARRTPASRRASGKRAAPAARARQHRGTARRA